LLCGYPTGNEIVSRTRIVQSKDALQDIYRSNWIQDYLVRYEAIRSGEVSLMVHPAANAATEESAIKALVLTPYRELEFSNGILEQMANAKHSALNAAFKYFDLTAVDSASNANKEIPKYSVNEPSSYWNLSGRSAPLKSDTTLSGVNYKAGSQIDYSVGADFDRCIDLPLLVAPGILMLTIFEDCRTDNLKLQIPLGTDEEPIPLTLYELVGTITRVFSFHGGPEETQAFVEALGKIANEMDE
jgi:hypothetical protein